MNGKQYNLWYPSATLLLEFSHSLAASIFSLTVGHALLKANDQPSRKILPDFVQLMCGSDFVRESNGGPRSLRESLMLACRYQ